MRWSLPGASRLVALLSVALLSGCGVVLSGCGAPKQSDASPPLQPYFEPMAPLVDYSVPPPLPRLRRPARRGEIATVVNADGDRIPADWRVEEMALSVIHASWRERPEQDLTVRMLAWQVEVDERPLLVERAILWIHFHAPGQAAFWRLMSVYRQPRETAPHLQGWRRANASPHSGKAGIVDYEEKPDSATVVRYFNDAGWSEEIGGFVLIDGEIGAGAWQRSTGGVPGFAYP